MKSRVAADYPNLFSFFFTKNICPGNTPAQFLHKTLFILSKNVVREILRLSFYKKTLFILSRTVVREKLRLSFYTKISFFHQRLLSGKYSGSVFTRKSPFFIRDCCPGNTVINYIYLFTSEKAGSTGPGNTMYHEFTHFY